MSKPVGKVRMVSSEMRRPANDKAVFVNILCEDESGAPFYFTAAAFGFDLKAGRPPEGERPRMETRPVPDDRWIKHETPAECSSLCHPSEPCSITEDGKCDVRPSANCEQCHGRRYFGDVPCSACNAMGESPALNR